MSKVVIFGTGEMSEMAKYYFDQDSDYEVSAFTVDSTHLKEDKYLNLPVIPFEQIQIKFSPDQYQMFVAISYSQLNTLRAEKYYEAKSKGYELVSYVHSSSIVANNSHIGENCFILERQTIEPFCRIGNNVVMWNGNLIGHHSNVGDHCFISSHVCVGGNTTIKPYCFLGLNSTLGHMITIGERSFISAGCIVTKNVNDRSVCLAKNMVIHKMSSDRFFKIAQFK